MSGSIVYKAALCKPPAFLPAPAQLPRPVLRGGCPAAGRILQWAPALPPQGLNPAPPEDKRGAPGPGALPLHKALSGACPGVPKGP